MSSWYPGSGAFAGRRGQASHDYNPGPSTRYMVSCVLRVAQQAAFTAGALRREHQTSMKSPFFLWDRNGQWGAGNLTLVTHQQPVLDAPKHVSTSTGRSGPGVVRSCRMVGLCEKSGDGLVRSAQCPIREALYRAGPPHFRAQSSTPLDG